MNAVLCDICKKVDDGTSIWLHVQWRGGQEADICSVEHLAKWAESTAPKAEVVEATAVEAK
jgi:hypothetical protein